MRSMLPVSRPSLGAAELEEVRKVFDTGWLGLGSTVLEFENTIKDFLGVRNVIAVNSGTSALHLALDGFGIGAAASDEVIVPSLTFCAAIQAIVGVGARPVFCEVEPATLNIDVRDVERLITPQTKAIMPVHYCGRPCEMDALLDFASRHDLIVLEDAAHAFGSSYKGKRIGSFGDVACFSFDPIKTLTCGEGGAIVLSDDEVAEEIRRKRNLGIDKDTWSRYRGERSWFYEVTTRGYRYHMSNINAAIGLAQFKKLETFISRRREIVESYNRAFAGLRGVQLLDWKLEDTAPFTYIVRVQNGKRDQAMDFLKDQGVGTGVHYIANHIQPFFASYACSLPVTENLWKEILTLPLYSDMTDEDVDRVVEAMKSFIDVL